MSPLIHPTAVISPDAIIGENTSIGPYSIIGDGAILSGLCAIHQFVRIGKLAFISGGAMVTQDVPPFCIAQGDRARLVALNTVGLQRAGISADDIMRLKRAFKIVFRGAELFAIRIATAAEQIPGSDLVKELLEFVTSSSRGITSGRRTVATD